MANICTVYLRLYLKHGSQDIREDEIIKLILDESATGSSYGGVPIFINTGAYGKYLDIIYGSKWSSGLIPYLIFCEYEDTIDIIFVRENDENEFDWIYEVRKRDFERDIESESESNLSVSIMTPRASRKCVYGVDKVRCFLRSGALEYFKHYPIKPINNGFYEIPVSGIYCTVNSLSIWGGRSINEVLFYNYDRASEKELRTSFPSAPDMEAALFLHALQFEYFYNGKLVFHASHRDFSASERGITLPYKKNMEWYCFNMDSWHNCLDQEFIEYKKNK